MNRKWRILTLAGLALVAALPFLARAVEGARPPRCAVDGVGLPGAPVVLIRRQDGSAHFFCCVGCAVRWLRLTGDHPTEVLVTDERTGLFVDAKDATFVRSFVITQPATRDRIHTFGSEADARNHAETYRGTVLTGKDRPF